MKKLYNRFNDQSFRLSAVIILVISDLIASLMLYLNVSDMQAFMRNWNQMQQAGSLEVLKIGDSAQFAGQIHAIMVKSVLLAIILHVIFHWGIYLAYYFEKRLAYLYLRLVTWIFAAFALWGFMAALFNGDFVGMVNLITFCGYLFVAYGLRVFPLENTKIQER